MVRVEVRVRVRARVMVVDKAKIKLAATLRVETGGLTSQGAMRT